MLYKNYSMLQRIVKIPVRIGLDAVSAWKELLAGEGTYFTAVLKAHMHFCKWLLFQKKQSVWPVKRQGKPTGIYGGFIVWQHFVKKKTKFSEIVDNK